MWLGIETKGGHSDTWLCRGGHSGLMNHKQDNFRKPLESGFHFDATSVPVLDMKATFDDYCLKAESCTCVKLVSIQLIAMISRPKCR